MPTLYYCSDGTRVSQSQIDRYYAKSKKEKYAGISATMVCECCGQETGNDNDHTIAQSRLKKIHKTELIWNPNAYVWSCRRCHQGWENFKSGEWLNHINKDERLAFLKKHDSEGYNIRITLTEYALLEQIQKEENLTKQNV